MATVTVAARVRGSLKRLFMLSMLVPLGACASFDGQPRAVLTPAMTSTANYEVATVLTDYYGTSDPAVRKTRRDKVIGIYMAAADANFLQFKQLLSRESKGSNFALGSTIIGLTSAATVAGQRAAQILTAGAAGLTGVQGKLSTEVYFAKTLPALFAGMEANRTRVRTNIFTRMGEQDSYPLSQAIADIASYEEAGSIDQAIKTMTAETADRADLEQARFENIIGVGGIVPDEDLDLLGTVTSKITELMRNGSLDQIKKVSAELGRPTDGTIQQQAREAIRTLTTMSKPGDLPRFVANLKTNQGVDLTQ